MSEYLSDEEQKEQILQWWKENGQFIVAGVGLGLVGIFSWRYWVGHLETQAGKASVVYEEMLTALNESPMAATSDIALEKLNQLSSEYKGTAYVAQGHLLMARAAVDAADLGEAARQLEAAIAASKDRQLSDLAYYRLAKVRLALQEYEAGLEALDQIDSESYLPLLEELRGDIYRALGNNDKARAAYEAAQTAMQETPLGDANLLQMKLSDLGVSAPAAD